MQKIYSVATVSIPVMGMNERVIFGLIYFIFSSLIEKKIAIIIILFTSSKNLWNLFLN